METLEKQEIIDNTAVGKEVEFTDTSGDTKVEEPKTETVSYTQEQVDEIVKSRLAREKKRQDRVQEVQPVQVDDIETNEVIEKVEKQPTIQLSEREQKILAASDAIEIKKLGLGEVRYEANLLADKKNKTLREESLFMELAGMLKSSEDKVNLQKNGVELEILDNPEFTEFSKKFSNTTTIIERVEMFQALNGSTKDPEPIGDVKNVPKTDVLKSHYTEAEIDKFTVEDYRNIPGLRSRVYESLKLN